MDFTLVVAGRYLRAKRRTSVSVVGGIAIVGIMLGVGVLSAVLSVTSGFQSAFREKVLGVNAHLLVLKYGWDFTEYREVIQRVRNMPGVTGAAPFLINPMMITRGDRIAGVLVKGVDPELLGTVLDLPTYIVDGGIRGLRRPGAQPPAGPADDTGLHHDRTLDDYLRRAREEARAQRASHTETRTTAPSESEPLRDRADDDDTRSVGAHAAAVVDASPRDPSARGGALSNTVDADRGARPGVRPSASSVAGAVNAAPSGATPDYVPPPEISGADDPIEAMGRQIREDNEARARQMAGELPGVIVGRTLARTLNVRVGDQVRIISPLTGADAALVRHGTTPRSRDFRVVGIFDAGFDEYDSRLVYVDLWEAQRFFEQGDAVTGVEVKVRDIERAAAIGRRIERELGGGPYHTLDWESLNRNLFTALRLQKFALSIVITIIIIVAAFNVVATLVMVVIDKRREVAILKAMGANENAIMRIFLWQGLVIGAVGTLLGLLFGGLICGILVHWHVPLDPQVYLIRYVPVRASYAEFGVTAAIAMLISLVASTIPAMWAARLTPVEGLRYE